MKTTLKMFLTIVLFFSAAFAGDQGNGGIQPCTENCPPVCTVDCPPPCTENCGMASEGTEEGQNISTIDPGLIVSEIVNLYLGM